MDTNGFDRATRALGVVAARRGALAALGGALAATVGRAGRGDVPARRKRCGRPAKVCATNARCCSRQCCLPTPNDPAQAMRCAPKGDLCCGADEGGGSCGADEWCCPPTATSPDGSCCPDLPGVIACCPANGVQPTDYCCPDGLSCCDRGNGCCLLKIDGDEPVGGAAAARPKR